MTTQIATTVVARHVQSRSPRRKEQDAVMAFLIEKGMVEVSVGQRGMTLTVFGGTEAEINRNIRLDVETWGWARSVEWNETQGLYFVTHERGLSFVDPTKVVFGDGVGLLRVATTG